MNQRIAFLGAGAVLAVAALLAAVSCTGEKSGRGFHLPEGNIDNGRAAFVQLGCNQCHTVAGIDLAPPAAPNAVQVPLGGDIFRVKTYGELVTSIIDPSHIASPQYRDKFGTAAGMSPMPDFNKTMTVEQMIDLVAFLHSRYKLLTPAYTEYQYPYGVGPYPMPGPGP